MTAIGYRGVLLIFHGIVLMRDATFVESADGLLMDTIISLIRIMTMALLSL